ncbi:hypothetical protein M3Y99_00966400 [Aphelenchoides fujianensis]|nr:hypothetical protein M3Y99_00966400 [Aphelenchoides fujianensis]
MERLEVEDEEAEGSSCDDLQVGNEAADFREHRPRPPAPSPSSPRVDYWRQAIHTWPRPEFEEPPEVPTEPPPPIPAVHLQLPQSGSSTSREPSPVSTTSKSRRYLPRSRDRQSLRLGLAEEEAGLSRSVEEFHFFELIGQRVQRASSDNECVEERRWSPPLTRRVSPANSQTRGVFRKLSIRRRRPLLMGNFEDAGCHSGDEAARDPKCALTARTSSLPSIAKPEIDVEDESWSRPSLEPPLISPTLGVDSNDHKPLLLPSSDEIDGMLGSSTPDSPALPARTAGLRTRPFGQRDGLRELPAIHEDAPEGDSSAETVQLRSASEHALNGNEPDDEEVENKRQSMIVIRGNPNHDDEAPLLSTLKSKSTTAIGNSCTFTRPTGRHTIDRIETNSRTHSPEVALSNGMLPLFPPLQVRNAEEEEKTEQPIAANGHSPDLNDRKGRIQRRKTVGPKRKTVHLRQPVDDIIPPSMFGGAVDEEEGGGSAQVLHLPPDPPHGLRVGRRQVSESGDKEKKREGSVISALWNSRQTKRKPSRSSLRGTESAVPADRKRLSLIEPGRKASKNATDAGTKVICSTA